MSRKTSLMVILLGSVKGLKNVISAEIGNTEKNKKYLLSDKFANLTKCEVLDTKHTNLLD